MSYDGNGGINNYYHFLMNFIVLMIKIHFLVLQGQIFLLHRFDSSHAQMIGIQLKKAAPAHH
jgi:hypothetical protein